MTNPYLGDTVARVTRDIRRKLEMDGRIFGTMQLALEYDIEPENMALGAMAGLVVLLNNAKENDLPIDLHLNDWRNLDDCKVEEILGWLWEDHRCKFTSQLIKCVQEAKERLKTLVNDE